ncbi:hypothetical protein B0J11DRAFT_579150 [Dendryphion nanum]|uniref:Uncharacterized protein n=1 Tax=Dendryphion nanum TaxID=256645 RepID=A0A9P9DWT1_9PLEO|nr:hypothetical protein B0J11DRAFT_579150 [Dendryphion nanum]
MRSLSSLPSPLALLSILLVLPSSTLAAPTRTHCRCAVLDTHSALSASSSADLLSTASENDSDPCANLGPELEYFKHTDPNLYHSYFTPSASTPSVSTSNDALKPLSTTVLMGLANRNGFFLRSGALSDAPRPTERPTERIICRSEPEAFSAFSTSQTTLLILHVIVVLVVVACLCEFACLIANWFSPSSRREQQPSSSSSALRLTGEEQRLRAFSLAPTDLFSPGVEKKMRAYESIEIIVHASDEKRISIAYVDPEDDDEMNRPVM